MTPSSEASGPVRRSGGELLRGIDLRDGGAEAAARESYGVTVAEWRRRFNAIARIAPLVLAAACVHLPAGPGYQGPDPLPKERRALFGLDPADPPAEIRKVMLAESSWRVVSRVTLRTDGPFGPETVEFELQEPPVGEPSDPRPAVLVSPILKGSYLEARIAAEALVKHGMIAAIQYQPDDVLPSDRSPAELADSLLRAVRGARRIVDFLAHWDRVDPSRLGSFGVSLGALKNIALLADEPRLKANMLIMGGLDLGWIFVHSREVKVWRYRERRARIEGVSEETIDRELRDAFWFHDEVTGRAVDGKTVLLVLARLDDKVPIASGGALRKALGDPETRITPTGHYTILLLLPLLRSWMIDFFTERFGLDSGRTASAPERAALLAKASASSPPPSVGREP